MPLESHPAITPDIIIQNPLEIPNTELRIVGYGDSIASYHTHLSAGGKREDFHPMIDYLRGGAYERPILRLDSSPMTPGDLTQTGYLPIGKNDKPIKIWKTDHLRELNGRLYRVMSVKGGKKALISNDRDTVGNLMNTVVKIERLSGEKSALYVWSDSFRLGSRPVYNAKFSDGTFGIIHAIGTSRELDIILKNGPKNTEKILGVTRIPGVEMPGTVEVFIGDDARLPKAIVQIQQDTLEYIRHITDIR